MTPPLLAYTQTEAAAALGMSRGAFRKHVLPELAVVRRGRRVLIPVKSIEQWMEENADKL